MPLKVAIIGAGIAGISAASLLNKREDVQVTVFEATNRTGGRIFTQYENSSDGTTKIEYGANWIHGFQGNPVNEIALQNNLFEPLRRVKKEKKPRRAATLAVSDDGHVIERGLYSYLNRLFLSTMEQTRSLYENPACRQQQSRVNIVDYVESIFQSDSNVLASEHAMKVLQSSMLYLASDAGAETLDDISAGYFGSYKRFSDRDKTIPQGFSRVMDCISKDIDPSTIQLNCPVKKVVCTDNQVHLEGEGGLLGSFDAVIVTCSLAFLKNHAHNLFEPQLSASKLQAIERLGIDVVDKIFLEFDHFDFLPSDVYKVLIARSSEQFSSISHDWSNALSAFAIAPSPGRFILISWITGKAAMMMENDSEEEVIKKSMRVLRKALKDVFVPWPKRLIRSQWGRHPYILGSYSYIAVGATSDDIAQLSSPVRGPADKPLVLFAGEATHPQFYSTTHGAYISGQREATRLIDTYRLQKKAKLDNQIRRKECK